MLRLSGQREIALNEDTIVDSLNVLENLQWGSENTTSSC